MLYIVTPLSRIENFNILFENIKKNLNELPVYWIVVEDQILNAGNRHYISYLTTGQKGFFPVYSNTKKALAGHSHRNYFINYFYNKLANKTNSDWLYFLDDDTLLHPDFLEEILPALDYSKTAIIFDQENKDRTLRLRADINNVKVCHIDMGQYVVNLSKLPEDLRFKDDDYCADGIFIEELFNRVGPEQFLVINKTLSTYNKLR